MTITDLPDASGRLIVALDFPSVAEARALTERLGETVSFYKIGLELIYAGGVALAQELLASGKRVFLDAKLHDIGATVERATASVAALGVNVLTVHGLDRKTLDAAVRGRGASGVKLLAVTVMTNLDAKDLAQQGICLQPRALALHRARMAIDAGFDGVVASGQEAKALRRALGDGPLIVTPGIRPRGAASDDQARVMTPQDAIAGGANYLVVGRPITAAADPEAAARRIIGEIGAAFDSFPMGRGRKISDLA
jgi:orotidine-5'-phosphate decarboxylase